MTDLEKPLDLNLSELDKFSIISNINFDTIPEEHRLAYELAISSLKSKQCNEPYETLLSRVLNLYNNEDKHGWDAFDKKDDPLEFYEFKPSSNTNKPSGTINDDTFDKISKYESLVTESKQGWVVLAGINKNNYSFDCIYKFPAEIYNEDRKKYLTELFERNKNKSKQTRATYSITINKSINLCKQFNKLFYVWRRII